MTSPNSAVNGSTSSAATTEEASNGNPSGSSGATVDMKTTAGSLAELKEKSPKVYNAMMLGIATQICNEAEHRQDRINDMIKEGSS